MRRILFLLLLCPIMSWAQSDFEIYKKQEADRFQQQKLRDSLELQNMQRSYDDYLESEAKAYAGFVHKVEQIWGKGQVEVSTYKNWVEYSADCLRRSIVDFEKGEARLEILLSNTDSLTQVLVGELSKLMLSQGTTKDYITPDEQPIPLTSRPILDNILTNGEGDRLSLQNVTSEVDEIIAAHTEESVLTNADGKQIKVVVTLPLAPNYIRERALQYIDEVSTYGTKYDIDESLILAVMHTESYFNPKATSSVPAFGLMQIVPKYAGKEAYQYVYGDSKLLSANYLYIPRNNIELGVTYLYLLQTRYFAGVTNAQCRMLCAIAAYNTGAGNVSRTFIGSTNVKKAIAEINKYSYDELYSYLRKKLPYQETRSYIQKVTEHQTNYQTWSK